jgi:hypothetical protein
MQIDVIGGGHAEVDLAGGRVEKSGGIVIAHNVNIPQVWRKSN